MSEMELELEELKGVVETHEAALAALNRQLAPVYARIRGLNAELMHTHHTAQGRSGELCVARWNGAPEAKVRRAEIFAELLRISESYGPTRNKVRDHAADKAVAERAIERIRKVLSVVASAARR